MGRNTWLLVLALVALVVGVGVLFTIQNGGRMTQLSLDLGLYAWQLKEPVPIPLLIGLCFGSGFALGVLVMVTRTARQGSRIRRLEQELAVSSTVSTERDDGWR